MIQNEVLPFQKYNWNSRVGLFRICVRWFAFVLDFDFFFAALSRCSQWVESSYSIELNRFVLIEVSSYSQLHGSNWPSIHMTNSLYDLISILSNSWQFNVIIQHESQKDPSEFITLTTSIKLHWAHNITHHWIHWKTKSNSLSHIFTFTSST